MKLAAWSYSKKSCKDIIILLIYVYLLDWSLLMPNIRPSSDLRNKYNEISEFCHKYNEPVFITKNGSGDLVLMSNAEYERLVGRYELIEKINEGLEDLNAGRIERADKSFKSLEKELGIKLEEI